MRETYCQHSDKVATQMGTQIHATRQLPPRGRAGPVRRDRAGPRGPRLVRPASGPAADGPRANSPCPPTCTGTSGSGPAPYRPYNPAYLPGNLTWNSWWDFGNGTLGDMGSHLIDLPFWALKLRHPTTVEAEGDPRPRRPRPIPSG